MTDPQNPSIVRYADYSLDAFERDAAKAKSISGGSIMELQQGENVVRFVPCADPGTSPIRSTGMHFLEALPGIEAGKKVVFACPKKELNTPCPVCDKVTEMRKNPNPIDRDAAEKMAVKLTLYSVVIDRGAPPDDPTHGMRVLKFGKTILEQLKTIRRNERVGGDFFRPDPQGFDIIIMKEGDGLQTKYKVIPDRNNSPLHLDVETAQALIDNRIDLETMVNAVVPEEVLNALQSTRAAYGLGAPQQSQALPAPARGAWPTPTATAASPAQKAGAGLFQGAPRGGQAVADAEFTDDADDDFGPKVG